MVGVEGRGEGGVGGREGGCFSALNETNKTWLAKESLHVRDDVCSTSTAKESYLISHVRREVVDFLKSRARGKTMPLAGAAAVLLDVSNARRACQPYTCTFTIPYAGESLQPQCEYYQFLTRGQIEILERQVFPFFRKGEGVASLGHFV